MKTIVCGTHFSVHAQEAANAAAALARRFSAALVLVHVHDAVARESGAGLTESAAHEQLAREAKRLRETGATVEEEFATGSPAAVLTETAQRREAGLLVVSTIGQIAPSRFVAGSVAEQAAETSSVPTLVIRRSLPFVEWARGERPLKIFLAYDFSATADNALRWLGQVRDSACEITVAYAAYPPQESWRLGIGALVRGLPAGGTKVSLRSKSDAADVAAFAARYGGGGHVRAAGRSADAEPAAAAASLTPALERLVVAARR
jgi:nucleotide-binding universal stress UspA family protein